MSEKQMDFNEEIGGRRRRRNDIAIFVKKGIIYN